MGRKRNRAGKYFYICIACIIVMFLASCATLIEMQSNGGDIATAQRFLDHGDYEKALKENQKVLSFHGNVPPGDEALFNMGLIYAHYGYSKKDYAKSLDQFRKLVKMFPQSPLVPQAKIWIGLLHDYEQLSAETEELSKSIKKLQHEHERLNKEIEELKKTIKKSKQVDIEIDGKKKELSK